MKMEPKTLTEQELVFGPRKIADFMPPYADIPAEFKKHPGTEWNRLTSEWFFRGLQGTLVPKDGIDAAVARRHLAAIMGSWDPKHEHKTAAVAYLMSQWFDRFERAS